MMKRSLLASAIVFALMATGLTGCDDNDKAEATPAASSTPAATTEAPAAPAKDTAAENSAPAQTEQTAQAVQADKEAIYDEKMNTYIECFNGLQLSIFHSIDRYASWLKDFHTGPTGKESIVYGIYSVSESTIAKCQKEIPEAAKLTPALEGMDEAATAFATSAVDIANTINEIDKYYEQENYKDDAFAQGKALHQTLLKNWEAFKPASSAYAAAIKKVDAERQIAHLNAIEQSEGKSKNYYKLAIMIDAEKVNNIIKEDKFEPETAMKQLSELEKLTEELKAKEKAQPDPFLNSFISSVGDYQLNAKKYIRRIRDKEPYSEQEQEWIADANAGWMVEGSYPSALKSYNEMVDDYNRLH